MLSTRPAVYCDRRASQAPRSSRHGAATRCCCSESDEPKWDEQAHGAVMRLVRPVVGRALAGGRRRA